jgi:hypothetical protein
MPDWFVELGTDNRPDLEFLIRELRDHRFTVEARESMVYLRATELNSLDHELDVLIRARDMLKFINGTARAFRLSYHGVRAAAVCHLREDGRWSRHICRGCGHLRQLGRRDVDSVTSCVNIRRMGAIS